MPTEPAPAEKALRDLFADTGITHSLDTGRIIRRSRARRLPKQIAAASLGTLALAGVAVLGVQVSQPPSPISMTAGEAYDSSAPAPETEAIKRAPAEKTNLCAGALAQPSPSRHGLQVVAVFPASAAVGTAPVQGAVRLTNTSDRQVVGHTPATPVITLSQDGVVLWHSNGPTILSVVAVDLAPGASLEYPASFTPVRCGTEDELAESFPADLPALPVGSYQLSALIDFTADPSMGRETPELDLVSGALSTIALGG